MTPDVKSYTWSQFTDAVLALLPEDATRMNVEQLLPLWIRLCVIDIQNYVPVYRQGHEMLLNASDFVGEGYASRAAMPPQASFEQCFLVAYDRDANGKPLANCQRHQTTPIDWSQRMELVHGRVAANGGPVVCINPEAHNFYLYPAITDCQQLSVFWNGLKTEFNPDEQTPFDEQMTGVVADYCKAKIAIRVDKDIPLSESYQKMYRDGRTELYLNAARRKRTT